MADSVVSVLAGGARQAAAPPGGPRRAPGQARAARVMAARLAMAVVIAVLLAFLALPLVSMFTYASPWTLLSQLRSQVVYQAVVLSLQTSLIALAVTVVLGTPVAYWLAKNDFRGKAVIDIALQLTIVMPPAVAGVGLLLVFGKTGLFGHVLARLGTEIPFTALAVVLAQVFTAAAFYITAASQAFAAVDDHLIAASRTLGVPPWRTFLRVTVPVAAPGMMAGATLGWARALGEFGATLIFAGNLPGVTQTLPLAIYTALQENLTTAVAISALLLVVATVLLVLVKLAERRVTLLTQGASRA